jgi:hypothetical protein
MPGSAAGDNDGRFVNIRLCCGVGSLIALNSAEHLDVAAARTKTNNFMIILAAHN